MIQVTEAKLASIVKEAMADAMRDTALSGWFTLEGAAAWSGLCTKSIELLIGDGRVKSRQVNIRSTSGGRRLVNRDSLNEFIESGDDAPTTKAKKARKERP